MDTVKGVVQFLHKEHDRLSRELNGIRAALAAFGNTYARSAHTRTMSAAGRARIAAAQRARWAKARENSGVQRKVVPARHMRTLSTAGRKKIAAAQRARWARVKAGKKTA